MSDARPAAVPRGARRARQCSLHDRTQARSAPGTAASRRSSVGSRSENPAELLVAAAPAAPAAGAQRRRGGRLLDRIPAPTPLELRDRALFELAYASGLRAEELVSLDGRVDRLRRREVRVEGKGGRPASCRSASTRCRALARYLERARPPDPRASDERPCSSRKTGRRLSTSDVRRRLRDLDARGAAPRVRHAHPHALRTLSRPTCSTAGRTCEHSGAARARHHFDHPGLHSGRVARLRAAYARAHPRA